MGCRRSSAADRPGECDRQAYGAAGALATLRARRPVVARWWGWAQPATIPRRPPWTAGLKRRNQAAPTGPEGRLRPCGADGAVVRNKRRPDLMGGDKLGPQALIWCQDNSQLVSRPDRGYVRGEAGPERRMQGKQHYPRQTQRDDSEHTEGRPKQATIQSSLWAARRARSARLYLVAVASLPRPPHWQYLPTRNCGRGRVSRWRANFI